MSDAADGKPKADFGHGLTGKQIFAWGGGALAAVMTIYASPAGRSIESSVSRRLEFTTRTLVGVTPELDSRIKIFAYDDAVAGQLQMPDLSLGGWSSILQAIAAQKPKMILIDKVFALQQDRSEAKSFVDAVQGLGVPVVAAAFLSETPITARDRLPLDRPEYQMSGYYNVREGKLPNVGWLPIVNRIAYGPHPALLPAFHSVGHIDYVGHGYVRPFYRLSADKIVPHWSLLAADSLRLDHDELVINGSRLRPDAGGNILVNIGEQGTYQSRAKNILWLIKMAREGRLQEVIQAGDYIVLLPQMFTGNTGFKETPAGKVQGPYLMVALLNSVLTGKWVRSIDWSSGWVFGAGLVGAAASTLLSSTIFPVVALTAPLLMIVAGLSAFIWLGITSPWLFMTLGFCAAAWSIYFCRLRQSERKAKELRSALEGVVSPDKLNEIISNPKKISLEASEQVVTLMFVDVVDFSKTAEMRTPREVFSHLRSLMDRITETVHAYGGIIDKTLGDGVLCYFGYQFHDGDWVLNHADQALKCAIKIQQDNLQACLDGRMSRSLVNPLRIGINTGAVYIGDLGGARRIDFTVIGHGVNFAQRLETACESHKIMLGATTRDLLVEVNAHNHAFRKRYVKIKHHEDLFEAYEVDPFADEPEKLKQAQDAYRSIANLVRKDARWPVVPRGVIRMESAIEAGLVVDFSRFGIAVEMDKYLAKGVQLDIRLTTTDGRLQQLFAREGMEVLVAEVRWGRKCRDGYLHGLLLRNVAAEKGDTFVELMRLAMRSPMSIVEVKTGTSG